VRWEFSSLQGSLQKGKEEIVAPGYQGSEENSCEMGVLTITRISPKGGKKQEMYLFSLFGCFLFSYTV
jgi:hypothetical protein